MVSQKGQTSADETSDYQKEGNTGYVPFITDLPKYLEPWQRFAFECTRYRNSSDTSSSSWLSFSSDFEDLDVTSLFSTLESERKDATPALDTPNPTPTDVAVIPDKEAIELPEEVAPALLSKGYKPHNRVQTPFPEELDQKLVDSVGLVDPYETCEHESTEEAASTFKPPIVRVNTTDSTGFQTKELSHKLSDAENPLETQSYSEGSCPKRNLKNPENLPLRRSSRLVKKGPNTENLPLRRSNRLLKQGPNTENLPQRRSNRLLKQGPNTIEKPAPKRKATEAAPGCRRSKRIRDSKSNTAGETNKRNRSKH